MQRVVNPRFDGALRHAKDLGDVGDRSLLDVPQHQDRPITGR